MKNDSKITLGTLKRSISVEFSSIDNTKAWITLIRIFLTIFFFIALSLLVDSLDLGVTVYYITKSIISFAIGLSMVGLFVLGHDCGHYTFHKTRWINDLVGIIAFTPLLNGFYSWRTFHNFHHNNTQVKGIDPDWPELLLSPVQWQKARWYEKLVIFVGLRTPIGLLLGFWIGMVKRLFFPILIPALKLKRQKRNQLILKNIFCLMLSLAFLYALTQRLNSDQIMWLYLLPAFVAATTGAFLTWMHHTQEDSYIFDKENFNSLHAQVLSSYNVHFPRIFEWLWLDINIHMPHHLATSIPWYHLKNTLESIRRSHPDLVREKTFSYTMITQNLKMIYLKDVPEHTFWQLKPEMESDQ